MKTLFAIILFLINYHSYSQIKIDNVGDDWVKKVEISLSIIEKYDPENYKLLNEICERITYSNSKFSSIEFNNTITLSQTELFKYNSNNVASSIIHELRHLLFKKYPEKITYNEEEVICYKYEYEFLTKIPNVEPWLLSHAKKMISFYSNQ
jgi:hypothetical protein